jgi:urease subunit gamma/beta
MRLTGKELSRLTIFTLAELARRRHARGRRLNAPEAAAIVCDEILEWAWDGLPLAEVVARAGTLLTRDDLMDGVSEIIGPIQIDALFPSGTILVVVPEPFGPGPPDALPAPGAVTVGAGPVTLGSGRTGIALPVSNEADVPIEVTSHFHFFEANPALTFDRRMAFGMRLNTPAGEAVRWEPGERKEIGLVPIEGDREVWGFAGLVDGPLDAADATAILDEAIRRGYTSKEHTDGE